MYFSGDFEVKKTRSAYVVSVVGEENSVRITNKEVEDVSTNEEPEMVAILLAIIEFARINEKALKNKTVHIIHDEDVLTRIKYLLEYKMSIDVLIGIISEKKYYQMNEFFREDYEETYVVDIND